MSAPALTGAGPAGRLDSPIHRLDPRAKLIGLTAVTLAAVTAAPTAWPVFAGCGALLMVVAATAGLGPGELWRRVRVVLPLVLMAAVALPFVRSGGQQWALGPLTVHEDGLTVLGGAAGKAAVGTVAAATLAATTSFPSLLAALERLRVPVLLVTIAGLTYRYLFVLGGEVQRMRQALAARCFRPRTAWHAAPVGRVAGALFLRAHARGERVHLAMVARGGGIAPGARRDAAGQDAAGAGAARHGSARRLDPLALAPTDLAFVAVMLVALISLRLVAA